MQFTPTQDFFSEETQSYYVQGLIYQIHESYTDEQKEKLSTCVEKWVDEGLVEIIKSGARLSAIGIVT